MAKRLRLTTTEQRRICGIADVDLRTLKKWMSGEDVRDGVRTRIERAVTTLKLAAAAERAAQVAHEKAGIAAEREGKGENVGSGSV